MKRAFAFLCASIASGCSSLMGCGTGEVTTLATTSQSAGGTTGASGQTQGAAGAHSAAGQGGSGAAGGVGSSGNAGAMSGQAGEGGQTTSGGGSGGTATAACGTPSGVVTTLFSASGDAAPRSLVVTADGAFFGTGITDHTLRAIPLGGGDPRVVANVNDVEMSPFAIAQGKAFFGMDYQSGGLHWQPLDGTSTGGVFSTPAAFSSPDHQRR